MNSEEIKEIGQFFLNIQNNNENKSNSVVDHHLVSEEIKEKIHISEQGTETRVVFLDQEIKKLKLELHKVECKLLPPTDNYISDQVKELTAKTGKELTAKVGKLGYQVGGYGGLISTLQKRDGERTAELNKIRKDYRELQEEMWTRFDLIEQWILADTSREKQKLKDDIIDVREDHDKQKNYTMIKANRLDRKVLSVTPSKGVGAASSDLKITSVKPKKNPNSGASSIKQLAQRVVDRNAEHNKTVTPSFAWAKIPISKLNNVSVRAHNALIEGGYLYVGSLLTESPYDLIKVPNFGRKCLREVMNALEEKNLVLNMQKFAEQKEERNSRNNTQRGNLWGFKT